MANNQLIEDLNGMLADHAVYYQKLRNYHWNVTGPAFFQLHQKFEEMYLLEQEHVDSIAERILGLGGRPISTLGGFLETSSLSEDAEIPSAQRMVENLRGDIETLSGVHANLKSMASEVGDDTTVNLIDGIGDVLAQDSWMLRAWLG